MRQAPRAAPCSVPLDSLCCGRVSESECGVHVRGAACTRQPGLQDVPRLASRTQLRDWHGGGTMDEAATRRMAAPSGLCISPHLIRRASRPSRRGAAHCLTHSGHCHSLRSVHVLSCRVCPRRARAERGSPVGEAARAIVDGRPWTERRRRRGTRNAEPRTGSRPGAYEVALYIMLMSSRTLRSALGPGCGTVHLHDRRSHPTAVTRVTSQLGSHGPSLLRWQAGASTERGRLGSLAGPPSRSTGRRVRQSQ